MKNIAEQPFQNMFITLFHYDYWWMNAYIVNTEAGKYGASFIYVYSFYLYIALYIDE